MAEITAEVREALAAAEQFVDAAAQAYDVTWATLEQRKTELRAAEDALELANRSWEAAARANDLAQAELAKLRRREGLVRTADGYALVKTP